MSEQTIVDPEALPKVNLHEQTALQEIAVRPGVLLRPMQDSDADALLAILAADPSIRKRVSVASKMHTVDDVQKQVAEYKADKGLIRYVIVQDSDVVGLLSFWEDGDFFPGRIAQPYTYGFGYFSSPEQRGKHLVTDGVKAVMTTAQASFRIDSFIAFCEPDNEASVALLQQLGLERTDTSYTEPLNGWQEYLYEKKVGDGN